MNFDDRMARVSEIHGEMQERNEMTWMLHRTDPDSDQPTGAVGAMILADDGHLLTVEASVDPTGHASLVVSLYDADMNPVEPSVTVMPGSTLITSPTIA